MLYKLSLLYKLSENSKESPSGDRGGGRAEQFLKEVIEVGLEWSMRMCIPCVCCFRLPEYSPSCFLPSLG